MAISIIHDDEWEDLDTELRRAKRARDEFDFSETSQPMIGTAIQPLQGTITIRHRHSGASRTYPTGHGSAWIADFARDLDAKTFG